jgi:hypothetical protein
MLAPLLAMALAGCHYDFHCRCCESGHCGAPQRNTGDQPTGPQPAPATATVVAMDDFGQQPPRREGTDGERARADQERAERDRAERERAERETERREAAEREQAQREEERATTERVHREIHDRLDRLGERLARIERILLLMSRAQTR